MAIKAKARVAVGYVRVSTERQAKMGESLRGQRKAIRHYVERGGFRLRRIFADEGVSGRSVKARPAFQRMLALLATGAADTVLVQRLSRLGRNARDLHNVIAWFDERHIRLVSIKEQFDFGNPVGRVMFSMLSAMAEFEREVSFEQMHENRMERVRRHEIFPNRPPIGYRWNKEERRLEIVESERGLVQRIFQLYIDGNGTDSVAYTAFQEGLRGRSGKRLRQNGVRYILDNPIYAGRAVYIRNPVKKSGHARSVPGPSSEVIEFSCPPIVTQAIWEKAQISKSSRAPLDTTVKHYTKEWLRNSLVCGICGSKIVNRPAIRLRKFDGVVRRRYACKAHIMSSVLLEMAGKTRCPLQEIDSDQIERVVLDAIVRLIMNSRWGRKFEDGLPITGVRYLIRDLEELPPADKQLLIEILLKAPLCMVPKRVRARPQDEARQPRPWTPRGMHIVTDQGVLASRVEQLAAFRIPTDRMLGVQGLVQRIVTLLDDGAEHKRAVSRSRNIRQKKRRAGIPVRRKKPGPGHGVWPSRI